MISADGSGPVRNFPSGRFPFGWAPDGKSLTTVITNPSGVSNLWSLPLDGSPLNQVTHFEDQAITNFAWSPEGTRLACIRVNFGSDVLLFTRPAQ